MGIDRKFLQKITSMLSDKFYLSVVYYLKFKKRMNWKKPRTFNEKIQWLKLYDRRDVYTMMVDKYEAKKYVADIIGEKYIIPTIGIYNDFNEIDFDKLPKRFVIKCTHDSGGVVICKDKTKLDKKKTREKIEGSLKRNFFYSYREWPYKNVKPRIIIEKYMEDKKNKSMRDYKFFCFGGKPEIMYLSEGLENHETAGMSFYDMDMRLIDCKRSDFRQIDYIPEKPKNFEKMKELSSVLSKGIPHLRVDWYEINGRLYFGELTFSTCSGMVPFEDEKWDKKLGDLIDLDLAKDESA
ncbi:glycosyl transferase [Candidatus Saccharibacteria bacterium]|nr:glycosyl transferase [Candidatus Saccharibacteria bacterium]